MFVQYNYLLGELFFVNSGAAYTSAYNLHLHSGGSDNKSTRRARSYSSSFSTSIVINMQGASTTFYILLGLLMLDALFEMSFVAATVAFLHTRAGGAFDIYYNGVPFSLHGKPLNLLVNQGHTSNGAAGTALILVGIGGFLTFPYLRRDLRTGQMTAYSRTILPIWLVASFLSMLLTFAALVYTQTVTAKHAGQTVDLAIASALHNQPYPNQVPYPLESWTPENWFRALLDLDLVSSTDRSTINTKYNVMKGWRWNLIPLFMLGTAVFILGFVQARRHRAETASMAMERGTIGVTQVKQYDDGESTEERQYQHPQYRQQQNSTTPMLMHIPRKPVRQ